MHPLRFAMKFGWRDPARMMCGSGATGTDRMTGGPGPLGAGNTLVSAVHAGSSPCTDARVGPIATSRDTGPTRIWSKGMTTAAGTRSTAVEMTSTAGVTKTVSGGEPGRDHGSSPGLATVRGKGNDPLAPFSLATGTVSRVSGVSDRTWEEHPVHSWRRASMGLSREALWAGR